MVGSAQYQDQEIEWVLAAIVSKQKQAYIQSHFKKKFGRVLNYNQIRYIKNKYGKDPKFNSPLVNIRAPMRATTPDPDESVEPEDGDEQESSGAATKSHSEAGPSTVTDQAQNAPEDNSTKATQPRRKRGGNEPRGVQSLVRQIPKAQRLQSSRQPGTTSGPTLRGSRREAFSPQQNASNSYLPISQNHTHLPPMALASLEGSHQDSPCARLSQGVQHPQNFPLMHSSSTDNGWIPSTPMGGHGWRTVKNTSVFTSVGGRADPLAMAQASSSPMNEHQPMGYMIFQSPTATPYQPRLPSTHICAQHVSQFSPAAPSVSLPLYAGHLEQSQQLLQQEQQLHSHTDIGAITSLPGSEISNLGGETYAHNLSGIAPQLIPSFQEVAIESTFPQHETKRLDLAGMGNCTNWTHATPSLNSSPQDISLFNFTAPSMSFPFESDERHTRYTGLTAASSQASCQTLVNNVNNANIYHSNFPTQDQQQHNHHSPQPVQQYLNFNANNALEQLLGISQTPILNTTTAMPFAQLPYPVNSSTMAFPPSMAQAGYPPHLWHSRSTPESHVEDLYGVVDGASGTIDPRLLTTNSASPHAATSTSSPLDEAKHEKEPPATS
ncbi:hypothetical protein ACQKWADRAFT_326915 [Trichoderma austrokoningii]